MRLIRLAALTSCLIASALGAQSITPEQLVGTWQGGFADIASGLGDIYRLSPDGGFTFAFSEMDCAKREVSFSGRWSVEDGVLVLRLTERRALVGGRLEPATGSCSSATELVGARARVRALDPPEVLRMDLGILEAVRTDLRGAVTTDGPLVDRVSIGGREYWRLSRNPDATSRDPD